MGYRSESSNTSRICKGILLLINTILLVAIIVILANPPKDPPKDAESCYDLMKSGEREDGIYAIKVRDKTIRVFCDMTILGGGWMVFQRRVNDHVDFYRNWASYKDFFGAVSGSYWLGLDNIHHMTQKQEVELYVGLTDFSDMNYYAIYNSFYVGAEKSNYTLVIGDYSGTAGDSLSYHNGQAFSTRDMDNDESSTDCSSRNLGAWWYKSCQESNLNGMYYTTRHINTQGINWSKIRNSSETLKSAVMMMRETNGHF